VSFQITILKVLAGHPDGRASVTELTRYVSVLMSSGSDWASRMRRLATRAPKLDIFTNAFVLRDATGWQITDMGRQFLASLEVPIPTARDHEQSSGPDVAVPIACSIGINQIGSPGLRHCAIFRDPAPAAPSPAEADWSFRIDRTERRRHDDGVTRTRELLLEGRAAHHIRHRSISRKRISAGRADSVYRRVFAK
jgi:hypothetical protein